MRNHDFDVHLSHVQGVQTARFTVLQCVIFRRSASFRSELHDRDYMVLFHYIHIGALLDPLCIRI